MDYEDRISIATPEGVEVELVLAGLGSRLVAALLDHLILGVILIALWIMGGLAASGSAEPGALVALLVVASFLVQFGYDVAFETLASGRTPGKRAAGLRVVRQGGGPVGFLAAAVRNLLRLADLLPGIYAVGAVFILATPRNQRLGDLAAGTLVVRERRPVVTHSIPAASAPGSWGAAGDFTAADRLAAWDVSGITTSDLVTVRRFLERRHELEPEPRYRIARDLAGRLRPRVVGAPPNTHPEQFLEDLAIAKAARS